MELSPAERQLLLAHRLAVFDGCVVYDAQPPVSAEHVQRLAEGLAGPIPEDLLRLWRTCFGGRLGYDLEVDYDGHRHPFSFSELFYPDSDGYHDLWGWIDRPLLLEAARKQYAHFRVRDARQANPLGQPGLHIGPRLRRIRRLPEALSLKVQYLLRLHRPLRPGGLPGNVLELEPFPGQTTIFLPSFLPPIHAEHDQMHNQQQAQAPDGHAQEWFFLPLSLQVPPLELQ